MLAASALALSAGSAFAEQARPILDKFPVRQAYHTRTDNLVRARKPGATLAQWNGSFTDHSNTKRTFVMVGGDPAKTNTTTTIEVDIVPVTFKYPSYSNTVFNPRKDTYSNGETVLRNFLKSPLLTSVVNFKSGGQTIGKTQYIDAFQRGNFWTSVQTNTNYHVLLSPTVLPSLTISVGAGQGVVETNPFGSQKVGTYGFGAMDSQINSYISSHTQITPDKFVFFISHNIFLTSGGCCIGGYHYSTSQSTSSQSYGYTTMVTEAGSFSQDVSAASHEIGEWMDDPFPGNNNVGCQDNGWLEVGDPLEGYNNYGGIPYTVKGFTYNLQDLVYIDYFGAPDSWPVGSLKSFNKLEQNYCPGQ